MITFFISLCPILDGSQKTLLLDLLQHALNECIPGVFYSSQLSTIHLRYIRSWSHLLLSKLKTEQEQNQLTILTNEFWFLLV